MYLKEFSLISPLIESVDIFQAIETVIAPELIKGVLKETNKTEEYKRKLP